MLETKSFIIRVWNFFPGTLCSHWIGPFVVSNVFPYGAVQITSLETNKVLKVNGHRLKPFYESWTVELTASVELAEPIYEEWACSISSQWHKTKALTRRQPSTKKKNRFAFFFFPYLFFSHFTLFLSFSNIFLFISTLRTMLCFKCGGIGRIWFSYFRFLLVFLFSFSLLSLKKKLCLIFRTRFLCCP